MKVIVDKDTCIGCGLCCGVCPEVFSMDDEDKAEANAFAEDILASTEAGMNGHVAKPFTVEELTDVLGKLMK